MGMGSFQTINLKMLWNFNVLKNDAILDKQLAKKLLSTYMVKILAANLNYLMHT